MPPKEKKEIDPEELLKRKFRAKCRFRAIGRLVIANLYWLMDAVDDYEGVEDVKKRIAQAVRGKAKKKTLLGINDKTLLNKPAMERSEHEKKYLYRIIGGLKCFKRYPNVVKRKLAAVTYFKYYSPNRVIVREKQEAHALYFLVTGEITISQLMYDDLLQKDVSVDIGVMQAGDMFGEVSLLHNIPRTATVTTNDHVELLALMRDDFKNVLQASVQKQWDEVRQAMSAFTYFDGLDEVARREGCIMAKMKSYDENDTILGDGIGIANFVYFMLSGRSQMIESMKVIVTTHFNKQFYTLFDPYVPQKESEHDLEDKYFKNLRKESEHSDASQIKSSSGEGSKVITTGEGSSEFKSNQQDPPAETSLHTRRPSILKQSVQKPMRPIASRISMPRLPEEKRYSVESEESRTSKTFLQPSEAIYRESVRYSVIPGHVTASGMMRPKREIRTYFMQVCRINPGASFGFGENMRDRRIVALTKVDCMLMPKVWLLQKNTANIWSRIQHYLEKKIPTKKELFEQFVNQRRWEEYRNQLIEDKLASSKTVNYTTVHDVPYSIRIDEMYDF